MPNFACYASRTDLKANSLGITATDTADDALLLQKIGAASRWIDGYCKRHFYTMTATRTFTAERADELVLPYDLLSITTLKTDEDDDWDYDNTWATTDYHLMPFNEFPKWQIKTKSGGNYNFTDQEEGVQLVGIWGYGNADANGQGGSATPYEDTGTTTNEALDASETGVDVANGLAVEIGNVLLVESEQMYITAVSGATMTVKRGVNGTTAATHDTGKTIYVYRYPDQIKQAAILGAAKLWRADRSGGSGGFGGNETGVLNFKDADYYQMVNHLYPFRRITVA